MLYANYIRNKMHNLAKIITASGYPLNIISKFKQKAVDYKIYGKTEVGKNLIPYPYTGFGGEKEITVDGITFTDNGDGSITVNGTTGDSSVSFTIITAENKTYIPVDNVFLSLKNTNDTQLGTIIFWLDDDESSSSTAMVGWNNDNVFSSVDLSNEEFIKPYFTSVQIQLTANIVFDNVTFYPQLEIGTEATEYEPYTETGVGNKTKNLIPYPYITPTKTINGITFTNNGDGSVTAYGTSTAKAVFSLSNIQAEPGVYTLSGCPDGGSSAGYHVGCDFYKDGKWVVSILDYGNSVTKDLSSYDFDEARLYVRIGTADVEMKEEDNLTFYPMFELGETASPYELYSKYNYKIPIVNTQYGDNLLPVVAGATYGNVIVTNNGDGSYTFNGTNDTGIEKYYIYLINTLEATGMDMRKTYRMSGGTSDLAIAVQLRGASSALLKTFFVYEDDFVFRIGDNYPTAKEIRVLAVIKAGVEYNNITLKPKLVEIIDTETTTIYTNSQLKDGESISYKADDLPQLQLYKGENNITVDTEIKPSEITVKYRD